MSLEDISSCDEQIRTGSSHRLLCMLTNMCICQQGLRTDGGKSASRTL